MIALIALLGGMFLIRSQASPVTPSPQQVYAEVQALEAKVQAADKEIKELEYRVGRAQAARANYEYVKAENAKLLQRLRQWAEGK